MIKSRLKQLREETGLSQAATAEKLGLSYAGYQNYEYGKRDIPGDVLIKAAELFGASVDYILFSSNVRKDSEKKTGASDDAYIDVPLFGSIAAGTPIEMIEVDDTFPIPTRMHEQYPNAFLLKVVGSSMNRILPDGCYALIDPCDDIEVDNKPYAVCVNGNDATIKRVHKLANGFELVPDSTDPTFKAKVYDYGEEGTERITVIGRVVYHVIPFDWSY